MRNNPIIWSDFPDPDVIRVEDTYFMFSTTMHFMPGGVILRSYDLINWEIATYIYDTIENTPGQRLEGEQSIYGKGMWAGSLRHHNGMFYACFAANDTGKTYLYKSKDINGPWIKQNIEGFYHDSSLLFDEERVYIVSGNNEIHLAELKSDLSGPKPDGLKRVIIKEKDNVGLAYEGAHIYKINSKYYVFLIHWPKYGSGRRVQACYVADSLDGEFIGKNVLDDDMGYYNAGIAQGGIVDTPKGEWYSVMFQDHGAVGRIPVICPIHWEDDFPVFGIDGKVPSYVETKSTRPLYTYNPLIEGDDFRYTPNENGEIELKKVWQWNHNPNHNLWSINESGNVNALTIRSGKLSPNLLFAVNTLTQRMVGPTCEASITLDASNLRDGDYAGICVLQGCYGFIGIKKEDGKYYLVMVAKQLDPDEDIWGVAGGDKSPGREFAKVPIDNHKVRLKVCGNFKENIDVAKFYYKYNDEWIQLGIDHKLYFRLDHFVGCRVGLFQYSTKTIGGLANFEEFSYSCGV